MSDTPAGPTFILSPGDKPIEVHLPMDYASYASLLARIHALEARIDHVARQQVSDSDSHEDRLVALERLHPSAMKL